MLGSVDYTRGGGRESENEVIEPSIPGFRFSLSGIVVGVRLTWREQQRVSSIIEEEFKHFTPSVGPDMYE